MSYSLTWLPDVLLRAGLKVAEVEGWEDRGRGDVGPVYGVLCHHTAGPKSGNMPSLRTLIHGRSDLKGPLAQLGLGRDGTYYVIAAGRANHAGTGMWMGAREGNLNFIGIEAENTGRRDDLPWPSVQVAAYQRGVAAILQYVGLGAERCAGHKEYARGRKPDPTLNMNEFREAVAAILQGTAKPPVLIPRSEPLPNSKSGRPTVRRGSSDAVVSMIQTTLRLAVTATFDAITEAKVREFQRQQNLVPDGIVGPKTWAKLDAHSRRASAA